jgi:Protein of unknown function (DUF3540)
MSSPRPDRSRNPAAPAPAPSPGPHSYTGTLRAEVLDLSGDDAVLVRLHRSTPEEVIRAELAVPHYEPAAGDRVLVTRGEEGWFVLGVLGAARRRPLTHLGPGLTATYREGAGVELRVAEGDLTLVAPGRVTLRAGTEVETVSPTVRIEATSMLVSAGRHELCAERVVERAGDVYRHAEGLVEVTAERARTLVTGDHDLCAGRTTITSDADTIVDGKRVLLG